MERRVANLLNSCNLADLENDQVKLFISEYFTNDNNDDDGWSDSEDSDSDEDNDDNMAFPLEPTDASDDMEEEPVVRVEVPACCDVPILNGNDGEPDILAVARGFSCGCKQIKCQPTACDGGVDARTGCITQFSPEEIVAFQLSIKDMSKKELDMFVVGLLAGCVRNGPLTEMSKRKEQRERKKSRSSFMLLSRMVCRETFLFLLDKMNRKRLDRLSKHYKSEGVTQPTVRSGGSKNNTARLTLEDTQRVVCFIKNFAEEHAVALPGRVPGFKRDDIRLLPSAFPKSCVYRRYKCSALGANHRAVGASTFRKLWLSLCPFIVVARPMTDLCWKCQNNNTRIFRSANLSDEEKNELILAQQAHLSQVDAERQFYRNLASDAKATVRAHGITGLEQVEANSRDCAMHYSFDFAQQVHYPANPAQPGPMYFLTARKCGIFGICCEGLPQQVNYLIDEAVSCSKGSNAVISYLHHFFEMYGCGEKTVHLHCDNCSGQNKNNYVMWYFCWRVQTRRHTNVTVNFMPPGHTKFSPDWCFGLFKQKYRRSDVSCLADIGTAVEDSTPESGINKTQLVGREDGTVLVNSYDWQQFLRPVYRTLPQIKERSHFRFSSDHPGTVFYRSSLAEAEESSAICDMGKFRQMGDMPQRLQPPGLSADRRRYLFNSIRPFVREDVRDLVCPAP